MGGRSDSQLGGRGHLYIVPGRQEAKSLNAIITGMISACHQLAITLFDLGFTYSYVFAYYALLLELSWEPFFCAITCIYSRG